MDTSDSWDDICEDWSQRDIFSQSDDIGAHYLTDSQYRVLFNDMPDSEFLNKEKSDVHTDSKQSDIEVYGIGLDMDCSESDKPERKRKSSDSECSRPNKVRVIVANPQFNAGKNR